MHAHEDVGAANKLTGNEHLRNGGPVAAPVRHDGVSSQAANGARVLQAHARESLDAFPQRGILQDVAARVLHACARKRGARVSACNANGVRLAGPCESNTLHTMLLKPHCGAVGVPFM